MRTGKRMDNTLWKRLKWVGTTAMLCSVVVFSGVSCSEDEDSGESEFPMEVKIIDGHPNMPVSGTISAQYGGTSSGTALDKIVDNNVTTCYQVNKNRFYVIFEANQGVAANYYSIRVGNGAADNDPRSWTLYGSNDGASWTTLDSQQGQTYANRYGEKSYLFVNEVAYRYYKLEVEENAGGASTQIAEWILEQKDVSFTPDEPHSVTVDESNGNMPTAGTLTAQYSDYPEGDKVGMLVDGDPKTKYTTAHDQFYLIWEGKESVPVNYYSLTSADVSSDNFPSSWILSGSNDKVDWVQLDQRAEQTFVGRFDEQSYLFNNSESYKYYRLEITANNGGELTQLGEWSMQASVNMDDLMPYASGWSTSDQTPMGNHYDNRHVTNDEDRAWLLDPANEPTENYGGTWKEYPVTLYPFGDPIPADVNQRAIGNCSALAVLASMVYIYPDFIKSLITDNGNGTYTVNMFDPQGKPVKVAVSSKFIVDGSGNLIGCSGKDDKATWSSVLEKAIMKWQVVYKVNPNLGGIGSEHVAPLFTGDGDSFAFSPGKLNAAQLERAVKLSLAEGKIVIGGFNKADMVASDGSGKTVTGHAWTLMYSANPSALFAMRNPWGFCYDADGKRDGVLNIFLGEMTSTIDLRIINPGIAAEYGTGGKYEPYIPPVYAPQPIRVAPALLRSGQ